VSISLRKRVRQACLLGCVSGAALLSLAVGGASAATYGGSTFTGSAEGWKTVNPECKLLNILELPLVCTTSGAYDGTAGAPPGSYAVKTEIPINLIGLFESKVTLESPSFTAVGTGSGTLALARAFDPGGLISLTPEYTYTAYLVNKSTNTKQKAFTESIGGEVLFANKSGGVSLTAGNTYTVQIETTTSSSIASIGLLGGEAIGRFDNVSVSGPDAPNNPNPPDNGNNGNNGNNGGNGNGGGNGSSGGNGANGTVSITSSELKSLAGSVLTGSATMTGNRVSVKGTCPTKAGATCTISLQGMLSRSKPATAGRKAKVKQGKSKNFALSVKPANRAAVKAKSKLLFKVTIKAGSASATAYKTLTLIHK
jgi:uncharacterized membrane protein YgcG